MPTLKTINATIASQTRGLVELVKGEGYCYFVFDDGTRFETESVMVPRISDLPAAQWVDEAVEFFTKMEGEDVMATNWRDLMEKNGAAKWEEVTNKPDIGKARTALAKGLMMTIAHIRDKGTDGRKGWFKTVDGWSRAQVKLNDGYMLFGKEDFAVVPSEHLKTFYEGIHDAILKGEFDDLAAGTASRAPAKRQWTQEQRDAQAKRMRDIKAGKKAK